MQSKLIQVGTSEYDEMIALRMKVLLGPIGIPETYINPQKEKEDMLIGGYEDDRLIACCILTRIDDTTVQLRQMAVDTALQSKGAGRSLLYFAERTAKEKGHQIIVMHARDTVMEFYRKCGYQIAGDRFFEVGIAHHKMQKTVA